MRCSSAGLLQARRPEAASDRVRSAERPRGTPGRCRTPYEPRRFRASIRGGGGAAAALAAAGAKAEVATVGGSSGSRFSPAERPTERKLDRPPAEPPPYMPDGDHWEEWSYGELEEEEPPWNERSVREAQLAARRAAEAQIAARRSPRLSASEGGGSGGGSGAVSPAAADLEPSPAPAGGGAAAASSLPAGGGRGADARGTRELCELIAQVTERLARARLLHRAQSLPGSTGAAQDPNSAEDAPWSRRRASEQEADRGFLTAVQLQAEAQAAMRRRVEQGDISSRRHSQERRRSS